MLAPAKPPQYLGLKILVAVMGILIVLGVIGLAIGLVSRMNPPNTVPPTHITAIPLPKGFRAIGISPLSAAAIPTSNNQPSHSMTVLIEDSSGHQALLWVDTQSGQTSLIRLEPQSN